MELAQVLDDLFATPPDAFVRTRDEWTRRLRAEGRAQDAATVHALRRPKVAAWAVDQLARHARSDVDALLRTGEELRAAQADLLAGHDAADRLRSLLDERRRRIAALTDRAAQLVADSGHAVTASLREDVARVLESATVDDTTAERVRAGVLVDLPAATGTDPFAGMPLPASAPTAPRTRASRPKGSSREAEAAAERATERLQRAERALEDAQRRLEDARRDADHAGQRLERARRERDAAQAAAHLADERKRRITGK